MELRFDKFPTLLVQGLGNQCCGMLFNSRGFKEAAAVKAGELEVHHLRAIRPFRSVSCCAPG